MRPIKNRTVASDLRFGKSRERAVGNNGELNASNNKDLLVQISKFFKEASEGGIVTEESAVQQEDLQKIRKEMLLSAFDSQDAHKELGEILTSELYVAANREGFARRYLTKQNVAQGSIPMTKLRMKNQVGVVASGPVAVMPQLGRDNFFFPPEFYINARPYVETREIAQSSDDVLEEKFVEGLEAVMVQEDRTFLALASATINTSNPLTTVSGTFTPIAAITLRNLIASWDLPVTEMLIATDIWNDIAGDPTNWANVIDPVAKHELLLTGKLGRLYGMDVTTDAYRFPEHKVLSKGQIWNFADAKFLGQYTDRGGLSSQPIDGAIERIPGRGWWITELVSFLIANNRAVAAAVRS